MRSSSGSAAAPRRARSASTRARRCRSWSSRTASAKPRRIFDHVTFGVLNQPNVRVRVDDGRNFLALSGEQFDVITADIIQPIHAGAGHLYSREYFELVRQALKPGGIALQWIGHRERSHYTLIMRTFLEVFPDATLWLGGELMVGSLEPLTLNQAAFDAKLRDPRDARGAARRGAGLLRGAPLVVHRPGLAR